MAYNDFMSDVLGVGVGKYDVDIDKINSMLSVLTEKERQVIELRYGLGPYEENHNLNEIASLFGVGFERIRQVYTKAMGKIQQPFKVRGMCESIEPIAQD